MLKWIFITKHALALSLVTILGEVPIGDFLETLGWKRPRRQVGKKSLLAEETG